jgi:carbon storage regulator CsrA
MLVLSRRPGQKVVFPKLGISIEVLKLSGTVAKIGITAPLEVEVHREEIHRLHTLHRGRTIR